MTPDNDSAKNTVWLHKLTCPWAKLGKKLCKHVPLRSAGALAEPTTNCNFYYPGHCHTCAFYAYINITDIHLTWNIPAILHIYLLQNVSCSVHINPILMHQCLKNSASDAELQSYAHNCKKHMAVKCKVPYCDTSKTLTLLSYKRHWPLVSSH